MAKERQWLLAEQRGQDQLAEEIFAHLVAEMPTVEPGPDFVARTVRSAWLARTRLRLVRRVALTAAPLLIGIAALGSAYELAALPISLVARAAVVFSHGLVWFLTSAGEGAGWWWVAERIGRAAESAIAAPPAAATVAAADVLALLAIYAFQRLLAVDLERTDR